MSVVQACKRIIDELKPQYWVIENVRGAARWFKPLLGAPSLVIYPYYFWGHFPDIGVFKLERKHKQTFTSARSLERAAIPYRISLAFAQAIERQLEFSFTEAT
jgi:hypothetical protein